MSFQIAERGLFSEYVLGSFLHFKSKTGNHSFNCFKYLKGMFLSKRRNMESMCGGLKSWRTISCSTPSANRAGVKVIKWSRYAGHVSELLSDSSMFG